MKTFLCALGCIVVYIVCCLCFNVAPMWKIFSPVQMRIVIPLVLAFGVFVYEMGQLAERRREAEEAEEKARQEKEAAAAPVIQAAPVEATQFTVTQEYQDMPGPLQDEWNKAKRFPHQELPDYENDAGYLRKIGALAKKGYVPALVKLSIYAQKRQTWIEAYYWLMQARTQVPGAFDGDLSRIRRAWIAQGRPLEDENVTPLFTQKQASIGRAYLDIDTGNNAVEARTFLNTLASQEQK